MSAATITQAVRRERVELVLRWFGQFTVNRVAAGQTPVNLDEALVATLLDDLVAQLESSGPGSVAVAIPDRSAALTRLADFPDAIAVTIDLLQAGVQVLGAFAVENAGPWAAWSTRDRNQFLGELDAVFSLLVHRQVGALCDRFLPGSPPRSRRHLRESDLLPDWARTIARRN